MKKVKLIVVPTMMLAMGMLLVGCQGDESEKAPVQAEVKKVEDVVIEPGITLENFDKIVVGDEETGKGGSTYEEVVLLFGEEAPGKASMSMGDVKIDQFQWFEGGMFDAEEVFHVQFKNGLVFEKDKEGFDE
jgi:hypothetical protein